MKLAIVAMLGALTFFGCRTMVRIADAAERSARDQAETNLLVRETIAASRKSPPARAETKAAPQASASSPATLRRTQVRTYRRAIRRHLAQARLLRAKRVLPHSGSGENTTRLAVLEARDTMVRAKFKVTSITQYDSPAGSRDITMRPVFKSEAGKDGNQCEENQIFGKYTPSGEIKMQIQNPTAAEQFTLGGFFYVDFTPAPE